MKIKQTRESDFKEIEIEIEDELYNLTNELNILINKHYTIKNHIIIYSEDGEKSFLFKSFDRNIGEKDTHSYKITIEKIPYN